MQPLEVPAFRFDSSARSGQQRAYSNAGLYKPFDDVTLASLKHSLLEHGIILREEELQRLMHAYNSLSTFRDVSCGLRLLKSTPSLKSVVFSNGTSTMISSSINNSPSLSPHASVFQDLISVDEIGCYKPSPRTYHHLITRLELGQTKTDIERTWLVSSNPFDVIGAANLGMKTVWVNRSGGKGWIDCLGDLASGGLKPTMIVKGVDEAVEKIIGWVPTKDANPTPRL